MRSNRAGLLRATGALYLAVAWPVDDPVAPPDRTPGWSEIGDDEELLPGDFGAGTEDFEAESWYAPRKARRIPISFSAVVLLLTLTVGIGMAAGLLAGPSTWVPPGHSPRVGNSTVSSPNGPSNSTNGTGHPGSGNGNTSHNSATNATGNGTSGNHSGTNGTGNSTGNHTGTGTGNKTGNSNGTGTNSSGGNGTGNKSGPGNGTGGHPRNSTGPGGNNPRGVTPPRTVYRNSLPWIPTDTRLWILVGAAVSLAGLAAALLLESVRPPPDRGNPWLPAARPPRVRRPRAPPMSPRDALEVAIERLRTELLRYERNGAGAVDREVREHIIHLYGTLLDAVSPGLGNLTGRTPREVEWLSVRFLGVRPETAHELTWLFEEARYSTHHLSPSSVDRAQKALTYLVDDLERRSLAL